MTSERRPRRDLMEWMPLIGLAAVTAISLAMYHRAFLGEVCGDDNTFHFAETARIADAVSRGDFDWWNPSANAGFPSAYYYQAVPAAVPGLLAALFGDVLLWFQLGVVVPLVLAPAAAYRGLRVLGAGPWAALGGAVAVAFTIGGSRWGQNADGVFLVGLYTQSWALAAYPLAFAHGIRWITRGRGLGPAVAWGLVVGMCHPVAGVMLGVALFAALLMTVSLGLAGDARMADIGAQAGRLIGLGGLLLIGSAAAWLPVLVDYDAFGAFPRRVDDEIGPGLVGALRWLSSGYMLDDGRWPVLTALVVPAVTWSVARRRREAWPLHLWIAALALFAILASGRWLKTSDDLFPAVRVLGGIQITLALAVGSALGGILAWAAGNLRWDWRGERGALTAALVTGLCATGLMLVVGGALAQSMRVKVSTDYPRIHRRELDELMPAIRAARPGRLQARSSGSDGPGVENHWFMMLPYIYADRPALVVYGGAALQSSLNFYYLRVTPSPVRAAWIYDAPLVLTNHDRGPSIGGELLASTEHFELRELPSPGLVGPVQVVGVLPPGRAAARKAVLAWQAGDQPMHDQVLAHHGFGGPGPSPAGTTRWYRRGGSWIEAEVAATAPTTFAIRESWHPRWTATVDGEPAAVRRISPDMMAIDVEAGVHAIALRFERPLWTWLLWLLAPGMVVLGWGAERGLRAWGRRRRTAPPAAAPAGVVENLDSGGEPRRSSSTEPGSSR